MKIQNCISIFGLFLLLTICFSCKDKDDDQSQGDPEVDPLEACCETPPLEATFGAIKAVLPNAFTPNGDGTNDIFFALGNDSLKIISSFQIYNDGSLIFEKLDFVAKSPTFGWDGIMPDGTKAPDGVYPYQVTLVNSQNEEMTFEAEICLRATFPLECVELEDQCAFGVQHDGEGGHDPNLPTYEECN